MGKIFFFPARYSQRDPGAASVPDRFEVFSADALIKGSRAVRLHGNKFFHTMAERNELGSMINSLNSSEEERRVYSHIMTNAGKKKQGFAFPSLMGIVNCTPDSFYPGSRFDPSVPGSIENLLSSRADILDFGGESTRPGSAKLPVEEEIRRLLPVVSAVSGSSSIPISIDTKNPETLERMLEFGIKYANDVSGFSDEKMRDIVRKNSLDAVLMHSRGTPETMQSMTHYDDLIAEIVEYFFGRLILLRREEISLDKVILDPGIGFAKTWTGNLAILANIGSLDLGFRTLVGTSRKSFIGHITGQKVESRLPGTISTSIYLANHGTDILRVHDVQENREALEVMRSIGDFRDEPL
ncbi:MAG: dihydropteroate synthase [Thermoplasmata archaeon]